MTDKVHAAFLDKFPASRAAANKIVDVDEDDTHLCWGCVRGNRRAFNIEFRRLSGSWPSLEYPWLVKPEWCPVDTQFVPGVSAPAGSIILRYNDGHLVLICGSNLRAVHEKILEHQVKYLAEADRPTAHLSDPDESVVTRIALIEPNAQAAINN